MYPGNRGREPPPLPACRPVHCSRPRQPALPAARSCQVEGKKKKIAGGADKRKAAELTVSVGVHTGICCVGSVGCEEPASPLLVPPRPSLSLLMWMRGCRPVYQRLPPCVSRLPPWAPEVATLEP